MLSRQTLQVLVELSHRKFQQIFWRANPSDSLQIFSLNTVTYGTASAPFLAVKCLQQLADDSREKFRNISQII